MDAPIKFEGEKYWFLQRETRLYPDMLNRISFDKVNAEALRFVKEHRGIRVDVWEEMERDGERFRECIVVRRVD